MADLDSTAAAADHPAPPQQPPMDDLIQKPRNATFSIWPPTQRTRDAVIARLIETLSAPSALSKRYGTVAHEEADPLARQIEEEAYSAVDGGSSAADDDGIAVLEAYSRDISKRVLEAVKARAGAGSAPSPAGGSSPVKLGSGPEPAASVEDAQSQT